MTRRPPPGTAPDPAARGLAAADGSPVEDETAAFTDFYLQSTRQPAIYINLFFALLVLLIVPVRSLGFGLPVFPSPLAAFLEWGVMVPASLATAYLRRSSLPGQQVERWTALLIALNFSAMIVDVLVWRGHGVPIPHEYSALVFVGILSVGGLSSRTTFSLCVLFLLLCVASFQYLDQWTPASGFQLYYDVVGIGIAFLSSLMLRHEANVAWTLQSRLNTMAFRDPLTGLANRHYLEERVAELFERANREQKTLGIALVDLDRFKGLNDSHGHAAGDAALRRVALELQKFTTGRTDIAARLGGDEFILVWFDVSPQHCEDLGRGILQAIAGADIRNAKSEAGRLAVSIGAVTGVPASADDFERYCRRADEELYRVKTRRHATPLLIAAV